MSDLNSTAPGAHERRDVEVSTGDHEGVEKPDGLGPDGTVPNDPDGVAAGLTEDPSHFNPEEDESAT